MQPLRNWLLLLLQSSHSPCNSPEPPSRLPRWLLETVELHIKLSPLLPLFSARTCGWIVRLQAPFPRSSLCRWVRCCYLNRESICGPAFTVDRWPLAMTSGFVKQLWCQTSVNLQLGSKLRQGEPETPLHANHCTTMLLHLTQQHPPHFFALSAFEQTSLLHILQFTTCWKYSVMYVAWY